MQKQLTHNWGICISFLLLVTIQPSPTLIHKTCQQAVSRCFAAYCFIHVGGEVLVALCTITTELQTSLHSVAIVHKAE